MSKDKTITRVSSSFNEFLNSDCETVIQPPFSILNKSIGLRKKGTPYLSSTTRPRVTSIVGTDFTLGRNTVFSSCTGAAPVPPAPDPEPLYIEDLVHWWKFNDGTTTAEDDGNGTKTNLTHFSTTNLVSGNHNGQENAIEFQGGTTDSRAQAPTTDAAGNLTAFGSDIMTSSFSVTFWGYFPSLPTDNYETIWATSTDTNWYDGMGMYWLNGNLVFWVDEYASRAVDIPDPAAATWFHCACVYDFNQNYQIIYIDGVSGSFRNNPNAAEYIATAGTRYFSIGTNTTVNDGATPYETNIRIADFRWYGRKLEPIEVRHLASGSDWP